MLPDSTWGASVARAAALLSLIALVTGSIRDGSVPQELYRQQRHVQLLQGRLVWQLM